MIRVSVLYPNESGKKFDHDYYKNKHMPLVGKLLQPVRYEVDKGVGSGVPGAPALFVAACHVYFSTLADFQKRIEAHGPQLMGDVPNYTDISPQIQISEIVV
jgi:uncharacterized protein (TIGR02118 family)